MRRHVVDYLVMNYYNTYRESDIDAQSSNLAAILISFGRVISHAPDNPAARRLYKTTISTQSPVHNQTF